MLLRRLKILLITVVTLWMLGLLLFLYLMPAAPTQNYLTTQAFVIFTGGKNRVAEGVEVFLQSDAEKILISGVGINVSKKDILLKLPDIQKALTMDNDAMVLGRIAYSTFSNVTETEIFVKLNALKNITVVTSNYHMPRSKFLLSNKLPDIKIEYLPINANNNKPLGQKVPLILNEYHKFIATIGIVASEEFDKLYWQGIRYLGGLILQLTRSTHGQ